MQNTTRRRTRLALGSIVILATFVAGVRLGVHLAVQEFSMMESSVKASLLTTELRAIRKGSADRLIPLKESELDGLIMTALDYQEAGQPWLFWPLELPYQHQRYLERVAHYRKDFPRPAEPPSYDCGAAQDIQGCEANRPEMAGFYRNLQQRNQELINKYGR